MTSMRAWQRTIREWAISKEWRGPKAETQRTVGDDISLQISELIEALEAFRESGDPRYYWESYTVTHMGQKFKNLNSDQVYALSGMHPWDFSPPLVGKPEGVGPELADTIIRILDSAEEWGLDMDMEVTRKMRHNDTREIRHGGSHL